MGTVVSFRARTAAEAKPPAVTGLSAPDAALMGVMGDLLRAVVRDRRISVSEVSSYDDPRGNGPVAVATIRVFGLAPLTVVAPTAHDGIEAAAVLDAAYSVAERLAEECDPERAAGRSFPLDAPTVGFESEVSEITDRIADLSVDPRRNAAQLRELMAKLVLADVSLQLAATLWGAMAAFGQTALWARGEITAI